MPVRLWYTHKTRTRTMILFQLLKWRHLEEYAMFD